MKHHPLTFLLLSLLSGLGLPACRHYSPVERHFLRVPALNAAELASTDRQKWLNQERQRSGIKEQALTENYLLLDPATLRSPRSAPAGEIRFFPPTPGQKGGMVALHWFARKDQPDLGRFWLFKIEGARYVPQSLARLLPDAPKIDRYALDQGPDRIVAYQLLRSKPQPQWRRVASLRWNGSQWRAE